MVDAQDTLEPQDDSAVQDALEGHDALGAPDAPRRRPWWAKLLIGLGVFVVVLVVSAIALYNFGGPSGSVYDPQIEAEYEALLEKGEAYPVEKRFTIPIPGCQCHSTDPSLTQQHRYRRMNECTGAGCHG